MQCWQRKAVLDGVKAVLPFQSPLRKIIRRLRPYATNPENDEGLLGDCVRQIDALTGAGLCMEGATIVEIGSGWNPILPIMYRLGGAAKVITVDQERLLDARQFKTALDYVKNNIEGILGRLGRDLGRDLALNFDRVADAGNSLEDMLEKSAIEYRAPSDFTALPSRAADAVVSRDVLEHIPEALLADVSGQSRRILKDGGFICHSIDMSDHWEHLDKTISRVNFLKYDGVMWELAGLNPQNYQNRLRRFEYVSLFEKNGFELISVSGAPDAQALRALAGLTVSARYAHIPHAELAVLTTMIVGRKTEDRGALH